MPNQEPALGVRVPQQDRSRASFERMLLATEELLTEQGSDDFTLNEVAKRAKVSIGSIYCRFDSKDDLIHAVQARVLKRVNDELLAVITRARVGAHDLVGFITRLVEGMAETLRRFSGVMRPFMLRASEDPVIAQAGHRSYYESAAAVRAALLEHRAEIRQPDPNRAAESAYRILYAGIGRHLGFGSTLNSPWHGDWTILKEDLAQMISAFLTTPPHETA